MFGNRIQVGFKEIPFPWTEESHVSFLFLCGPYLALIPFFIKAAGLRPGLLEQSEQGAAWALA